MKKKNIFSEKMASENSFKKVRFTYKSQIVQLKIQKRCGMIRLNVPNFLYINKKSYLGCLKYKKHAIFSKNPIILGFWLFSLFGVFRKYKENWE